jgi:hypothetical protein
MSDASEEDREYRGVGHWSRRPTVESVGVNESRQHVATSARTVALRRSNAATGTLLSHIAARCAVLRRSQRGCGRSLGRGPTPPFVRTAGLSATPGGCPDAHSTHDKDTDEHGYDEVEALQARTEAGGVPASQLDVERPELRCAHRYGREQARQGAWPAPSETTTAARRAPGWPATTSD